MPEQEIANRRALGLPVTVVEEDHFREPHEVPSSGEEDVADVGSTAAVEGDEGNKDQVLPSFCFFCLYFMRLIWGCTKWSSLLAFSYFKRV